MRSKGCAGVPSFEVPLRFCVHFLSFYVILIHVYNLFYYMDMQITEQDVPDLSRTLEILATNFVKGVLK